MNRYPQSVNLANWITAIATTVLAFGVYGAQKQISINSEQIRVTQQTALAEMMIDYGRVLLDTDKYVAVHKYLSDGGKWYRSAAGPETTEDWEMTHRYVGHLEQVESWRQNGIIDLRTIDNFYSHRIAKIYNNNVLHEYLINENPDQWKLFNSLVEILKTMPSDSTFVRRTTDYPYPPESDDESSDE